MARSIRTRSNTPTGPRRFRDVAEPPRSAGIRSAHLHPRSRHPIGESDPKTCAQFALPSHARLGEGPLYRPMLALSSANSGRMNVRS